MHARLKALEARASLVVEGHDLSVEHHTPRAQGRSQRAHLGVAGREVAEVAALELDVAVVAERHDPDPVPLDLESELLLARRQRPAAGHHRLDALRERLVRRIRRRIHAVDHPVVLAGPEQGVAPVEALPVEGRYHLVVAELLRLEGAAIPDEHRAGAVLALWNLALELEVLERVVLGPHGEAVLVRVLRHAARKRPRRKRAVVLEAQIPVEAASVVLLHHEAGLVRLPARAPLRLRGLLEVALRLVGAEPVGHDP